MILVSKKSRFAEPGMKKIVNYVKKRRERKKVTVTKGKSWCVWYKVSKLWRHSWCTIHVELGRVYLSIDPLPEILEACLESLFADHVIGLRLALIPGHRDQGPRSHVMKSLISYGEPLRQVWPWTNARDHGVLAVTSINWRRRLGLFIRSSSPHSQSRDILASPRNNVSPRIYFY